MTALERIHAELQLCRKSHDEHHLQVIRVEEMQNAYGIPPTRIFKLWRLLIFLSCKVHYVIVCLHNYVVGCLCFKQWTQNLTVHWLIRCILAFSSTNSVSTTLLPSLLLLSSVLWNVARATSLHLCLCDSCCKLSLIRVKIWWLTRDP